jgi:uncharacterized protein (TIGR00297 family)
MIPLQRPLIRVLAGTAAAAAISAIALRARALSPSGAASATLVGGSVFAGGGTRGAVALVAFFVSSTLLGRLPSPSRSQQRRGNQRDAVQVLANGGVASLLALAAAKASPGTRRSLTTGFAGAVAAAAADTWATEVGSRSRQQPRLIVTWAPLPAGSSGAVTPAGLAASAAGAAAVAMITSTSTPAVCRASLPPPLAVVAGGIAGSLSDSLLGATLQEVRFCDVCTRETEALIHDCGHPTRHLRGQHWCNNDVVNTLATAIGAATAISLSRIRGNDRLCFNKATSCVALSRRNGRGLG